MNCKISQNQNSSKFCCLYQFCTFLIEELGSVLLSFALDMRDSLELDLVGMSGGLEVMSLESDDDDLGSDDDGRGGRGENF